MVNIVKKNVMIKKQIVTDKIIVDVFLFGTYSNSSQLISILLFIIK